MKSTRQLDLLQAAVMPGGQSSISPARENGDAARPTAGREQGRAIVGGILHRRPRERRPRLWERKIYSGTLSIEEGVGVLQMKRGAFIRKTDADGAIVSDSRDDRAGLLVNIGDKVITLGPEDVAILQVTRIEPGWCEKLSVRVLTGVAENGNVHVLNAKGLCK